MSRITLTFERLKQAGRKALIPFITAGDPNPAFTVPAMHGMVKAGADNVTVIERAQPPSKGKSLKAPLMIAAFLFAGFTALCVGLLRVFLRRGFSLPSTASRTLQMPVLAVAPMKAG